ncbi:MAG: hypothetical protein JWM74_5971 [Myxococcaceae bacterium]|nr:hypothetical protein [Myxococcaceae bacterium]
MKTTMRALLLGGLFFAAVPAFTTGCASSADDASAADEADDGTSEGAVTATERQAQLNALRARVNKDFAGAASLRSSKLVFVVRRLNTDGKKAAIFAHIMKRNAAGKDAELADADYKGSAYEEAIKEGYFDGPELTAVLQKKNGAWTIMKKGDNEAYVVGPTDVAYTAWDKDFGIPRAWLGFQ